MRRPKRRHGPGRRRRRGGTRLTFHFLGDEVKLHVPLTRQLCLFQDDQVVTRESIRLFMRLAVWWKVKGNQRRAMIDHEVGQYGLEVHRVEVQEV
jgi:hypothetical protein